MGFSMRILYLTILILTNIIFSSHAATVYVRTDGGTSTQCVGTTDAAYDGSGTGEACALKHPFYAFGWHTFFDSSSGGQSGVMSGGDTVIIKPGSYRMGYSSTETFGCNSSFTYDCASRKIPSGTSGNHTKIIGCSSTGCAGGTKPELWASGRPWHVLQMENRSYIDIQDLDITDHATCGEGHFTLGCGSADANELSGKDGIRWTNGSNITLTDTDVHGFYRSGIRGTCADCSFLGTTRVMWNSFAGFDMDTCNNDGTCGLSSGESFTSRGNSPDELVQIDFNGCVENGSNPFNGVSGSCYNNNNGGFGDGFGGSTTSGTWDISYTSMSHNTSDGLDLKYCTNSGCDIDVYDSIFAGNAANQIKTARDSFFYRNLIEGNCDYLDGKSLKSSGMTLCTNAGDAWNVNIVSGSGDSHKFYSNTVVDMSGNVFVSVVPRGDCSNKTVDIRDSIIDSDGRSAWLGGGTSGFSDIDGGCSNVNVTQINSNINGFNTNPSGSGNNFNSPALSGQENSGDIIEAAVYLASGSPARDLSAEATTDGTNDDYNGFDRGAAWDSGALEFGSSFGGSTCGNGSIESGEACDDSDTDNGDGCSSTCSIESGWSCSGEPSTCTENCGNSSLDSGETCDDGGMAAGDGCNAVCQQEAGWTCTGEPSTCTEDAICGNGTITTPETCDDSNTTDGDGCSSECQTEESGKELFLTYAEIGSNTDVDTHDLNMIGVNHNEDDGIRADKGLSFFQNHTITGDIALNGCTDNIAYLLEAYWKLNDNASSSSVSDDFLHNYPGTLRSGTAAANTSTATATGKLGNAFTFDGSTSSRNVHFGDVLDKTISDAFSIEAFIKTGNQNEQCIYCKVDPDNDFKGHGLIVTSDGYLRLLMIGENSQGDFWYVTDENTTLDDDAWHHVAATYDGSQLRTGVKLYINGTETSSYTYTGTSGAVSSTLSNAASAMIGAWTGSSNDSPARLWDGEIDNVRIYDASLDQGQIDILYNSGNGDLVFISTGGEDGGSGIMALSESSYNNIYAQEQASDGLSFSFSCLSSAENYTWKLLVDGALKDNCSDSPPFTNRYFTWQVSGTSLTLDIYDDVEKTNNVCSMSATATGDYYRYILVGGSFNSSTSGVSFSGTLSNFEITVDDPPEPPASGCSGATTENCTVPALSDGQSGGSCTVAGSCSYSCSSGSLSKVSNTCSSPVVANADTLASGVTVTNGIDWP
jgi:cysteine-rich repeat protein